MGGFSRFTFEWQKARRKAGFLPLKSPAQGIRFLGARPLLVCPDLENPSQTAVCVVRKFRLKESGTAFQ
jgi:hypothetical protein